MIFNFCAEGKFSEGDLGPVLLVCVFLSFVSSSFCLFLSFQFLRKREVQWEWPWTSFIGLRLPVKAPTPETCPLGKNPAGVICVNISPLEFWKKQNFFVRHFAPRSIVRKGVLPKNHSLLWDWTPSHAQRIYKGQNSENPLRAITFDWSDLRTWFQRL